VEKRLNSVDSIGGLSTDCLGEDCDVVGCRYELTSNSKIWFSEARASASWIVLPRTSEKTADLSTLEVST
jgi:hypothetical protein